MAKKDWIKPVSAACILSASPEAPGNGAGFIAGLSLQGSAVAVEWGCGFAVWVPNTDRGSRALGAYTFPGGIHPDFHICGSQMSIFYHASDNIASQRLDWTAVVISSAVMGESFPIPKSLAPARRALQSPVIAPRRGCSARVVRMVRIGVAVAGTHGKTTRPRCRNHPGGGRTRSDRWGLGAKTWARAAAASKKT